MHREKRLTRMSVSNFSIYAEAGPPSLRVKYIIIFKIQPYTSKVRLVSTHLVDSATSLNTPWRQGNYFCALQALPERLVHLHY